MELRRPLHGKLPVAMDHRDRGPRSIPCSILQRRAALSEMRLAYAVLAAWIVRLRGRARRSYVPNAPKEPTENARRGARSPAPHQPASAGPVGPGPPGNERSLLRREGGLSAGSRRQAKVSSRSRKTISPPSGATRPEIGRASAAARSHTRARRDRSRPQHLWVDCTRNNASAIPVRFRHSEGRKALINHIFTCDGQEWVDRRSAPRPGLQE